MQFSLLISMLKGIFLINNQFYYDFTRFIFRVNLMLISIYFIIINRNITHDINLLFLIISMLASVRL